MSWKTGLLVDGVAAGGSSLRELPVKADGIWGWCLILRPEVGTSSKYWQVFLDPARISRQPQPQPPAPPGVGGGWGAGVVDEGDENPWELTAKDLWLMPERQRGL